MTARARILTAALLASVAAAGLWQWQGARKREALAHREAWLGYLQGPLADLLYGSSRLRPLLAKKPALSSADRAVLKEAVEHLERSSAGAQAWAANLGQDPFLQPLTGVVELHRGIGALLRDRATGRGARSAADTLKEEAGLRLQLWRLLAAQRERLLQAKTLSRDEVLEMNALLYSLQEETEAAQKAPAEP